MGDRKVPLPSRHPHTPAPSARSPRLFCRLWQAPRVRDRLFEMLPREDLCRVRLASKTTCSLLTWRLFMRITVSFTASTFTKPSRTQALARVGHYVEHLTFHFAHSDATFLPPLVHPADGHEVSFLYKPHTSMASVAARPKYANSELGGLLTQQYPPLFHAATNVPSFINALRHLVNMRHLTIRCPGQDPRERYRRDVVDYALISLRIAVERASLTKFSRLTLTSVHPAAFNYLRHVPGFGSVPSAAKRWRQIRKLHVSVEAWDFYGSDSPGLDHLKIIDDYVRSFGPNLEKLSFTWTGGRRGPCPLALAADPLFSPPPTTKKLFKEIASPMSPLPACPPRKPMYLPKLRGLQVRNANMNVAQLSDLVKAHRRTVRQFEFENVVLTDGGSWEQALAPLTSHASGRWARTSPTVKSVPVEPPVPALQPAQKPQPVSGPAPLPESATTTTRPPPTWDDLDENSEETASPSAAVRAVSLDLINFDLGLDQCVVPEEDEGAPRDEEGPGRGGGEDIYFGDDSEEVLFYHDDGGHGHVNGFVRGDGPYDEYEDNEGEDGDEDEGDDEDAGGVKTGCNVAQQNDNFSQSDSVISELTTISYSATLAGRHKRGRHRKHTRAPASDGKRGRSGRRHGGAPDEPKRSRDLLPLTLPTMTLPSIISAPLALLPALSLKPAPLLVQRKPSTRAPTPLSNPHKAATAHLSLVASPSPPPSLSYSVDSLNSLAHSPECATHPVLRFEHLPPPYTPPLRPPPPSTYPYQHPNYPVLLQPAVYTPPSTSNGSSGSGGGDIGSPAIVTSPNRFFAAPDAGISPVQRDYQQEEHYRLLAEDADLRAGTLKRAREAVLAKLSREFQHKNNEAVAPPVAGGCATSFTHGARFRGALFAKSAVSVIPDAPGIERQSALVPLMLSRG